MKQYQELVKDVLGNGIPSDDRTGTGTRSLFGRQIRFDLNDGFPLVTTKKTWWKGVLVELLWMMSGSSNVNFLHEHGVHIWDKWADKDGNLGPVYGVQWRKWKGYEIENAGHPQFEFTKEKSIDQLKDVVERIKTNPNCRRLIVSAWNVADIGSMRLPPCHCFFQFYVRNGKLSCQLYQRSADLFLGVPFNIASYALLTHLIAKECDLGVGEFIYTFGDVHLYNNHLAQANEMLTRDPKPLPQLQINIEKGELFYFIDKMVSHSGDDDELTYADFHDNITLDNYQSHAQLKGDVSI